MVVANANKKKRMFIAQNMIRAQNDAIERLEMKVVLEYFVYVKRIQLKCSKIYKTIQKCVQLEHFLSKREHRTIFFATRFSMQISNWAVQRFRWIHFNVNSRVDAKHNKRIDVNIIVSHCCDSFKKTDVHLKWY